MVHASQKIIYDITQAALNDAAYAPVMRDLNAFGYGVKFKYFGGAGQYTPHMVYTSSSDDLRDLSAAPSKFAPLTLTLCARYGRAVTMHTFLHEIYHFYQDSFGMFFIPRLCGGAAAVIPSADSFVRLVLFNEAMAATESIRAARRMSIAGNPVPWRGALWSFDWHGMSRGYAAHIQKHNNETQAAAHMFCAWYGPRYRRRIYAVRASALHREIVQISHIKTGKTPQQIHIPLSDVCGQMPSALRPAYLDEIDINKPIIAAPLGGMDISTQAEILAVEKFKQGSAAFLWRQHSLGLQNYKQDT